MKTRRIMMVLVVALLICLPGIASAIEEINLPPEVDTRPRPQMKIADVEFEGFVNSKEPIEIQGEVGVVYNLCEDKLKNYCADEQGVIVLNPEEATKVSEMVDKLDAAMKEGKKVEIKLSGEFIQDGQRKILKVK